MPEFDQQNNVQETPAATVGQSTPFSTDTSSSRQAGDGGQVPYDGPVWNGPQPVPVQQFVPAPPLQPTTFNVLKGYGRGQVVEFPPFAEGQPLIARVRRPSVLALAKGGRIPNSLMSDATSLFMGTANAKGANAPSSELLSSIASLVEIIAEESLIEPTYKEIKEAGLDLTDDQMMFLFNYTQQGVKELGSFRS